MARHRHRQHATPTTLQAHLDRLRQEFPNIRPFEEEDDINWWNDGLAALNANRLLLAERFFKKLTLAQPEHFDGYYGLAIVYHRRHRLADAILFADESVRLAEAMPSEGDCSLDPFTLQELKAFRAQLGPAA